MSEDSKSDVINNIANDSVKELADTLKKITDNEDSFEKIVTNGLNQDEESNNQDSNFKVANTNLPAKVSLWTKIKNVLFYQINVELTPHQQKIENEINDFLHQEITWKSLKEAAFSEVPITFRGKKIF